MDDIASPIPKILFHGYFLHDNIITSLIIYFFLVSSPGEFDWLNTRWNWNFYELHFHGMLNTVAK